MNKTRIDYLDWTWNPLVGCFGVECAVREVCFAWAMAKRQKHRCLSCYQFIPHLHKERVLQPANVLKPARIGVCFMGDLFDDKAPKVAQSLIFKAIGMASWHTFICLTKQPQNINLTIFKNRLENLWLGVSVNRKADVWRIIELQAVETPVRIVSFEPLYEDIILFDGAALEGIGWVIVGAQTRPNLQPPSEAVYNIVNQARALKIPVFCKNNLEGPALPKEYPHPELKK